MLSRESRTVPAPGHDWGEWEITKQATETEEGIMTRICKNNPSHVETRSIPKPAPTPSDDPVPSDDPGGDENPISYRNTEGDGNSWTKGGNE